MDITFDSLEELYQRLLPALRTKKEEMRRNGFSYIKEEDIWNYLKIHKWKSSKGLTLFDMVNDVLNTEDMYIDDYLKREIRDMKRQTYLGEENAYEKEDQSI